MIKYVLFIIVIHDMKQQMVIGGFLCLLLLAGAGCAKEETQPQTKSADTQQEIKNTTPDTPAAEEEKMSSFSLQAEPAGKGRVKFTWSAPEGAAARDGFRIVRGPNPDPSYPGNFWYHPKGATAEAFWINLPKGKQHFRVCAFENNKCTVYSNDVTADIQ